jgi:NDP-sugar pyrophosphorylase family protein
MKAMVLAAGLGTRLRPLTNDRPKALVMVAGRTLLEITLERLRSFGVRAVIVNVHHHAEMICEYLRNKGNFGMRVEVSREEDLLDTGGGLKKAAWFFLEGGASAGEASKDEPFLVHNVDVISTIDFAALARLHAERRALATLAVQKRETKRPLLFDAQGQLRRRATPGVQGAGMEALAFAGIHVISPRIFAKLNEGGAFSIVDAYLRLAAEGETILGFRADGAYWRDLGRVEDLRQAEQEYRREAMPE